MPRHEIVRRLRRTVRGVTLHHRLDVGGCLGCYDAEYVAVLRGGTSEFRLCLSCLQRQGFAPARKA